jgi:hypothetical protein
MSDPVPYQTRIRVNGDKPVMAIAVFHAVMRAVQRFSSPKAYLTDLAHDAECIYTNANQIVGYGICLRDCGTHSFPLLHRDERHRFDMIRHMDLIAGCRSGEKCYWLILCDTVLSPECIDGKYCQESVSFIEADYNTFRRHFTDADIH